MENYISCKYLVKKYLRDTGIDRDARKYIISRLDPSLLEYSVFRMDFDCWGEDGEDMLDVREVAVPLIGDQIKAAAMTYLFNRFRPRVPFKYDGDFLDYVNSN